MEATRKEFPKSIPCFHCSKSLQQLPRHGPYVGYVLTDSQGIERILHRSCIDPFASNQPWQFESDTDKELEEELSFLLGYSGDL